MTNEQYLPYPLPDRRDTIASPGPREEKNTGVLTILNTVVFLAILMVLAAVISIGTLMNQSVRLDEAQSLWQTGVTVPGILDMVARDVHVPLYHLLLHYWRTYFGGSIAAARSLSLIFFLLTIPMGYLLGKLVYNRVSGMFFALLLAISPFLNWYGTEARMYSLLALATVANQYFFIRIIKRPAAGVWIGYAATAIVGMYSHYFFALVLLTEAIFYFMRRPMFPRRSLLKFAVSAFVVLLAFAPWVYYVYNLGAANNTRPHLTPPNSVDLFNAFAQFLFGFQTDRTNTMIVSLWPLTIFFGFFALRRNKLLPPETLFFILALFLPVVAAFAASFVVQPFFLSRYLIVSLPALYLVMIWLLSAYPPRTANWLRTILLVVMFMTLAIEVTSAQTPVKEDYRDAVAYLNERVTPQDVVVLSAPFTIYPFEYYYSGSANVLTIPPWDRFSHGPIPEFSEKDLPGMVAALKGNHKNGWVLLSYDQGYEEKVRLYFDTHFQKIDEQQFSKDLTLYEYRLRYDQVQTAQNGSSGGR